MANQDRLLARLALLGVATFALVVVLLHGLRPDLDPRIRPVSHYAVGPYGALMVAAFLVLAASKACLATVLARTTTARLAPVIMALDAVAVVLVALFATDVDGTTTHGRVHEAAAITSFLASLVSFFLFAAAFRRDARWKGDARGFLVAAIVALVAFAVLIVASARDVMAGGAQRVFIGTVLLWLGLAAWGAARRS